MSCPNCKGKNFESGNSFILRTTQKEKFICNDCGIEFWDTISSKKESQDEIEMNKELKLLTDYMNRHPEQTFWQAVANLTGNSIF